MSTKQKIVVAVLLTIFGQVAVEWVAFMGDQPARCAGVGVCSGGVLVVTSFISTLLFTKNDSP